MSKLFVSLLRACFGSEEKEKEMMKPYHFSICDFLRGWDVGMGRSILLQQPFCILPILGGMLHCCHYYLRKNGIFASIWKE